MGTIQVRPIKPGRKLTGPKKPGRKLKLAPSGSPKAPGYLTYNK